MSPILLGDPRTAAADAAARYGVSPIEGLRFAARTFAEACVRASTEGAALVVECGEAQAADPSLDIYAAGLPGPGAAAWWRREVFAAGDAPGAVCPEVVDITGRGRILIYGPLLALPPGDWRLSLRFELCAEAARHRFRLEFGHADDMTRLEVKPSGEGLYEAALGRRFDAIALAEARIWVAEPAFHGELRLHGARIEWAGA